MRLLLLIGAVALAVSEAAACRMVLLPDGTIAPHPGCASVYKVVVDEKETAFLCSPAENVSLDGLNDDGVLPELACITGPDDRAVRVPAGTDPESFLRTRISAPAE